MHSDFQIYKFFRGSIFKFQQHQRALSDSSVTLETYTDKRTALKAETAEAILFPHCNTMRIK